MNEGRLRGPEQLTLNDRICVWSEDQRHIGIRDYCSRLP